MKYVLVGSGQFSEKSKFKEYAKDCKVIACDGGIDHCRKDKVSNSQRYDRYGNRYGFGFKIRC